MADGLSKTPRVLSRPWVVHCVCRGSDEGMFSRGHNKFEIVCAKDEQAAVRGAIKTLSVFDLRCGVDFTVSPVGEPTDQFTAKYANAGSNDRGAGALPTDLQIYRLIRERV